MCITAQAGPLANNCALSASAFHCSASALCLASDDSAVLTLPLGIKGMQAVHAVAIYPKPPPFFSLPEVCCLSLSSLLCPGGRPGTLLCCPPSIFCLPCCSVCLSAGHFSLDSSSLRRNKTYTSPSKETTMPSKYQPRTQSCLPPRCSTHVGCLHGPRPWPAVLAAAQPPGQPHTAASTCSALPDQQQHMYDQHGGSVRVCMIGKVL